MIESKADKTRIIMIYGRSEKSNEIYSRIQGDDNEESSPRVISPACSATLLLLAGGQCSHS
jgi:hypothetical protein